MSLSEACRRLRERNQPNPRPLIFLAHPSMAENVESMGYLLGIEAAGMEVHVMPSVREPTVPLHTWLARPRCRLERPGGQCGCQVDHCAKGHVS
jgi:CheY-like chemotaxis protein